MTETELSEKVQDSEIEVLEGDADADRWTNYGKDRVYLNNNGFSGKFDAYVDLETGEFVCDYSSDFRMEIENGVATITKHWSASGEDYSEVVVRVRLWETEEEEEEVEDDAEDDENETESIVDRLEKDREYNSNKSTIDSEKEREDLREHRKKLRNAPNSELSDTEKATKWSAKASAHLGERVKDTDILREMEVAL
jgi:hypothetical protein